MISSESSKYKHVSRVYNFLPKALLSLCIIIFNATSIPVEKHNKYDFVLCMSQPLDTMYPNSESLAIRQSAARFNTKSKFKLYERLIDVTLCVRKQIKGFC